MHVRQLVFRNAARSPLRLVMTVVAVSIMVTAFIFPNALVEGQRRYLEQAANDRVIIMPKRGGSDELPFRYAEEVSSRAGVLHAAGVRWASLQLPGKEGLFFASNAVDPKPWLAMHPEIVAPARSSPRRSRSGSGVVPLASGYRCSRSCWTLRASTSRRGRTSPSASNRRARVARRGGHGAARRFAGRSGAGDSRGAPAPGGGAAPLKSSLSWSGRLLA